MKPRRVLVASLLLCFACGEGDGSDAEPGLETGPCLSGQQCAAGLVCASELCVDLDGGSGDDGASSTPPAPGNSSSDPADGTDDANMTSGPFDGGDAADAGGDAADAGGDAADAGGDDGIPPGDDDAGAGGWCPVPPSALSCTTTCDLFQFECYDCPHEAGDLCTYYDYQYDNCLTSCEYVKTTPGDFTYEVFACRQYAGADCSDADVDCLLEIDCEGA